MFSAGVNQDGPREWVTYWSRLPPVSLQIFPQFHVACAFTSSHCTSPEILKRTEGWIYLGRASEASVLHSLETFSRNQLLLVALSQWIFTFLSFGFKASALPLCLPQIPTHRTDSGFYFLLIFSDCLSLALLCPVQNRPWVYSGGREQVNCQFRYTPSSAGPVTPSWGA